MTVQVLSWGICWITGTQGIRVPVTQKNYRPKLCSGMIPKPGIICLCQIPSTSTSHGCPLLWLSPRHQDEGPLYLLVFWICFIHVHVWNNSIIADSTECNVNNAILILESESYITKCKSYYKDTFDTSWMRMGYASYLKPYSGLLIKSLEEMPNQDYLGPSQHLMRCQPL